MADSSKDIQLRELKDMISDLKKMIKTLQATVDAANKREEALTQERDKWIRDFTACRFGRIRSTDSPRRVAGRYGFSEFGPCRKNRRRIER